MGYAARASNGESPRELTDRKFKHVAAVAIDRHAGVIGQVVEALNITNEQARVSREFVADLSVRIDAHDAELGQRAKEDMALSLRLDHAFDLVNRGFLARMKWLFLGK